MVDSGGVLIIRDVVSRIIIDLRSAGDIFSAALLGHYLNMLLSNSVFQKVMWSSFFFKRRRALRLALLYNPACSDRGNIGSHIIVCQ